MSTANTPAPSPCTSAVTFDSKSEAVVLPGGMVSVAGVTVMTGGAELTWGSCLLAFGVWGTLTGLVVLAINLGVVGSVAGYRCGRKRRGVDDGKVVLVGDRGSDCVKIVTV
ncbi:hypothetical protein Z043_103172 [Scleropages formosus]|uniref:Transmembrane protein n=1 Tax=Scleropages formosus TaxID=113540 RepID=A0A0P7XPZ3_SCLFO|nr:hypothetical protein Z043_103172 [Scleropages formosus]